MTNKEIPHRLRTKFYEQLCRSDILRSAWHHVHSSITLSKDKKIKDKAKDFANNESDKLSSLQKELKEHKFVFSAHATPIKKQGKNKERPVVNIDTIEGRIVQKAILDILQAQNGIKKYLHCKVSYGGLADKNVAKAVNKIYISLRDKKHIYAKAVDITSFFTKIKKDVVIEKIKEFCKDADFLEILDKAVDLKIPNLDDLRNNKDREYLYEQYIYNEEGVPQGSCLSPLLGNIFLYEIDKKMEKNTNITYIRYIDDVIIMSREKRYIKKAFDKTLIPELAKLGLELSKKKTTSCINLTQNFISYLGVDISEGRIKPTQKAMDKFIDNIKNLLNNALNMKAVEKKSLYEILDTIDKKIKGWACHYSFCHANNEMKGFDEKVDRIIGEFYEKYQKKLSELSIKDLRKELGVKRATETINIKKDIISNYISEKKKKCKQN